MAISITDPELQAQLQRDMQSGVVPQWDSNDAEKAQAYVDYFNKLTGNTAMRLVSVTTYKFEITETTELKK